MGDVYPELRENEAFVLQVATSEEERFAATLRQGLQLFETRRSSAAEERRVTVRATTRSSSPTRSGSRCS